jgi:hypothetical protein
MKFIHCVFAIGTALVTIGNIEASVTSASCGPKISNEIKGHPTNSQRSRKTGIGVAQKDQFEHRLKVKRKIYLKKENFRVERKRIILKSKDGVWQTKNLHVDDKGFFVIKSECFRVKGRDWDHDDGEGEPRYACSTCGRKFYNYDSCDAHIAGAHRDHGYVIRR